MKEPRPAHRGALESLPPSGAGSSAGMGGRGWEAWVLFLTLCALTAQLMLPLQKKATTIMNKPVGHPCWAAGKINGS